jgi:NAD(P)-dependent dehydrogenase (short-subunit alcohol dehydrogenase family)
MAEVGEMRLVGPVAVVTGGAQGIGAATAIALARFGADVAICDRNVEGMAETAAAIEATGGRCVSGELDVRNDEAVEEFIARVHGELGELAIVVNNAGGGFWSPFMDVKAKGQAALVDENFTSVTNVIRHAVPAMSDGGAIVNVTSVEAFHAAPGFAVYAAMKAAVEQLTRSLALELSPRRIRVNCVAPDAIPTPGDAELAAAVSGGSESGYDQHAARVPLGMGTPEDCAGPIVFLASDFARFVTGSTIMVDGGSTAAGGWSRGPDGVWLP